MIKLTFWQKLQKWILTPLYTNIALPMCEEHAEKIRKLPLEVKERIWNSIINDSKISVMFRYDLEQNHKEHFLGDY